MNELKDLDIRESLRVVTKNELITAEGLADLSVNARKLFYLAIAQCKKSDKNFVAYKTTPAEIAEIFGITRQAVYQTIDELTDELMRTFISIRPKDGKAFDKRHICERCLYSDDKVLEIKLHNDLADYLLGVDGDFTQPLMRDFLRMKSKYTIAIWHLMQKEMCSHKPLMDMPIEFEITLEELRNVTNTKDKLLKMSDFRRKVLDKAIAEIKKNCYVQISYEDQKKGKTITGFKFKVENYYSSLNPENLTPKQLDTVRRAELVHKIAEGTITPAERIELDNLRLKA